MIPFWNFQSVNMYDNIFTYITVLKYPDFRLQLEHEESHVSGKIRKPFIP